MSLKDDLQAIVNNTPNGRVIVLNPGMTYTKTGPHTQYLRAAAPKSAPIGVDREKNVLRGYVVAQLGPFKSEGRGEFDQKALDLIVSLGNAAPNGLKSRLDHATMSDDGSGKFLGRARDFTMATATDARTGKKVPAVRADLKFDRTALESPPGGGGKPYGVYVMDLAESDPAALSSSLVLQTDMEYRLNKDGAAQADENGEPLPPLWRPTVLYGSDIVDTGDAVDSLLSPQEMAAALDVGLTPELERLFRFDRVARLGTQLLDGFFRKHSREEIRERCGAWLERYLALRFPESEPLLTPRLDARKARMNKLLS